MKKLLILLLFFSLNNPLFAQDVSKCDQQLKQIVKSTSEYKKKFGNRNIFLEDYVTDGYVKDHNYFFTIYYDNKKVGVFNRIASYKLNLITKKLTSEVLGTDRYLAVSYNKKLAADVNKICK